MDEKIRQIIRQIIREELSSLIRTDRYTFAKLIQILDGRNIMVGTANGTSLATETTQKIGFYGNKTAQQSKINDPSGQVTDKDDEARTAINAILDALETLGVTSAT